MSQSKNGGAGTTTASKEPWSVAAPWLTGLVQQGSELQGYYNQNPFSQQQLQAYANQNAQSDYMRGLVPSLLGQLQSQPVGFDPSNPSARAKAWDWGGLLGALEGSGTSASLGGSMTDAAARQAAMDAAAKAAAPAANTGFRDQSKVWTTAGTNTGGYGSWNYGDTVKPGTQAFRDMNEYYLMGGNDPNNLKAGLLATGQPWQNYSPLLGFNTTDGTGEGGGGPGTQGNW